MVPTAEDLVAGLGEIDIYVFDQIARGRIAAQDTVLDAGCGGGRNLIALARLGCRVLAADRDPAAVDEVRRRLAALAPPLRADTVRHEAIEDMTFPERAADVVLCTAVLHFARDDRQFEAMIDALWRRLRPGGLLVCRLGTSIGADLVGARRIDGRRYQLPGGHVWYLADEDQLMTLTRGLGGDLADPLKTTVVQQQRCMTTWVVRRR